MCHMDGRPLTERHSKEIIFFIIIIDILMKLTDRDVFGPHFGSGLTREIFPY